MNHAATCSCQAWSRIGGCARLYREHGEHVRAYRAGGQMALEVGA